MHCLLLGAMALLAAWAHQQVANAVELAKLPGGETRPGITPKEILEARGYLAENVHFKSKDGYTLRVTRGRNPLINKGRSGARGRLPILFVHGILESHAVWVVNSANAAPADYSNFTLSEFLLEDAQRQLGDEPAASSLPLLAMNFGHEVWLMSRRGFPGSQEKEGVAHKGPMNGNNDTNLLSGLLGAGHTDFLSQIHFSLDPKFWNFSLDEQALFDFPQAVDLVRRETAHERIAVVGHSAGGALTLMSLSLFPELNDKLAAAILWSPSYNLGFKDFFNFLPPLLPLLQTYVGSAPPAFLTEPFQRLLGLFCKIPLAQSTLCEGLFDVILGPSKFQQPMGPEFINSVLYPTASHEIAQLIQVVIQKDRQMHTYNNNPKLGKPYDLSQITNTKLSFWAPRNDFLVSARDVRATLPLLNVPHNFHLIDAPINHNGFFWHKNTSRLTIIPTLRELQMLAGSR